jgi:hypothetical protein
MTLATLLAHQGGWDEAALIAVPILVIIGVLAIAKRRVDAAQSAGIAPIDERPAPPAD